MGCAICNRSHCNPFSDHTYRYPVPSISILTSPVFRSCEERDNNRLLRLTRLAARLIGSHVAALAHVAFELLTLFRRHSFKALVHLLAARFAFLGRHALPMLLYLLAHLPALFGRHFLEAFVHLLAAFGTLLWRHALPFLASFGAMFGAFFGGHLVPVFAHCLAAFGALFRGQLAHFLAHRLAFLGTLFGRHDLHALQALEVLLHVGCGCFGGRDIRSLGGEAERGGGGGGNQGFQNGVHGFLLGGHGGRGGMMRLNCKQSIYTSA